jgi:2-polyprenyl-3-methyl-5-hydroxy-6-metoxy-1,4-benzoquinol methylase
MEPRAAQPGQRFAFGVDPKPRERYRLRQSRYEALATDIDRVAAEQRLRGEGNLRLLDVGSRAGILKMHLDARPNGKSIDLYGTDILRPNLYRPEEWSGYRVGDLMGGMPEIPSEGFDVVVCEQVPEHLTELKTALRTLERLLRPGGTLFVGVPIFPPGVHLLRRHLTPLLDRIHPPKKVRGHVQAFSHQTFVRLPRKETKLDIVKTRGFRVISGGPLRPLEESRSWWRFNRWLGRVVPGLCVEIQAWH